jgi:hypothetical protein
VAERDGGFAVDDDGLVADLCDQLDRLPLAIELAAARATTRPMTDLVGRLGDRFRLLRGQRQAAGRHQTLQATVGWSYDLLSDDERLLFDRLSVFSGGFTLTAAEAVCADDLLEPIEVDGVLSSLTEKSMVTPGPGDRYILLETLRQYGEAQLAGTDEPRRLRQAHVLHYRDFVVAAHDGLQGRDELAWWRRLQADWPNIRSAFTGRSRTATSSRPPPSPPISSGPPPGTTPASPCCGSTPSAPCLERPKVPSGHPSSAGRPGLPGSVPISTGPATSGWPPWTANPTTYPTWITSPSSPC